MASTTYQLTGEWSAAARYTAAIVIPDEGVVPTGVPILVSNLNQYGSWIAWALTEDDTPPAITPLQANPLMPGHAQAMKLADGERLWLAMRGSELIGFARVQE